MASNTIQREYSKLINKRRFHYYKFSNENNSNFILIHGLGVSSRYMLPLAECLVEHGNVYVVDVPGFGKSDKNIGGVTLDNQADSIAAFIKVQNIENVTLIANSFGTQICLNIMERYQIVDRSVLIGPTINVYERTYFRQIMRWFQNLYFEPTCKMAGFVIIDV